MSPRVDVDFWRAASKTDFLFSSWAGLTVPLAVDEELESRSAGMERVVMTWVASREKKVTSRWEVLANIV